MNIIKTLEFVEGKKVSEKCSTKTQILSQHLSPYCNFTVSEEKSSNIELCGNKIDIARIKNRISFITKEIPNFRIDVTLSYTVDIKNNPHELKQYKELVLTNKKITPENFLVFSDFKNTKYEVEFEYIGKELDDFNLVKSLPDFKIIEK